jgi:hypothetical protein
MEPQKPNRTIVPILIIVLILAALGITWIVWSSINNTIHNTVNPLEQTNKALNTQVADLLHPTPTIIPDPVTIITKVQALSRLETIQYSVEKVITAEENQGVLKVFLGDKLLFVAHGVVIAGIDLSKMEAKDMWLQDGVLNVRLPQAEILVATLDNNKSYVYDRQTGIFTQADPNLETSARKVAEVEIRQAAINDGILDQAQANAQTTLLWFFESLGYKEVKFVPLAP